MAEAINKNFPANVELIASKGGVFEVTLEGKLIFSKKALNRFPEDQEILDILAAKD